MASFMFKQMHLILIVLVVIIVIQNYNDFLRQTSISIVFFHLKIIHQRKKNTKEKQTQLKCKTKSNHAITTSQ